MSMFTDLFDKARSLLGRPAAGSAVDAVPHGTLDRLVYDDLLAEAPALRSMVDDLAIRHGHTQDLVRDVLMAFLQHNPSLRDKADMKSNHLLNWAVAKGIQDSPETAEARQYTVGSKYAAAMTTIGVTGKVRELLAANTDLAKAVEDTEQAQAERDSAADALVQALAGATQADEAQQAAQGGYTGEGPLTAAAQAAADQAQVAGQALTVAVAGAQQASEALGEATEAAQDAAGKAVTRMRGPIQAAIKQAADDLAQEQEVLQAWGVNDGVASRWSFTERVEKMALLRSSELTRYLKLLGRFTFQERSLRSKKTRYGRDEVYSVERSGRLVDVQASELALLSNRHTRLDFLSRWSEGQLLTRAYRGVEREGKGALILCLDTSESMNRRIGDCTPAVWSKAWALAMLQRCRAENRDFVGILFSSRNQVEVHRFPKGVATIEQTIEFVSKAFNGGTDFQAPLTTAMDLLEAQFNSDGVKRGDIVFLTDDDCAVSDTWLAGYRERKARLGFRTWGVAIPKTHAGSTLEVLSDNVRAINDFVSPEPVADLMKAI